MTGDPSAVILIPDFYRPDIRIIVNLRHRPESSKPAQDPRTLQSVNHRGTQGRRKGFFPVVVQMGGVRLPTCLMGFLL